MSPGTVLVVDEAGMVGTRTLGRLLDHAADASTKVVLVGDPRQLPEIDAGGLLRGLGQRLEPIQLTQNRRQYEAWERAALAALRAGHVDSALKAYDERERIVTRPTASATRDAMAADWWAASLRHDRVLMVAARWYDVDDLNARARQRVAAAGRLSGPVLHLDGAPYQAGDRVMTLRNDRRLGVRNGTIATISAVDPSERAVTIRTDRATCHTLPAAYLDAGHLHHAYATTIHKAQGVTVDQALVLGNDALYQEAGYVALSRGRFENRIYRVDQPAENEHHGASPPREPLDALTSALRVSHSQHLAIDHRRVQPSFEDSLARRYHERELLRRVERLGPRDPSADVDALRRSRTELDEQLDDQRAQLGTLSSRRPRRNRREQDVERLATVQRVDRLTKQLEQTDRALADAHESRDIYDKFRAEHRDELQRLPQVESEIGTLLAQLVASYHDRPPAYLASLGPWPEGAIDRCEWMEAATTIEDYRHHQHISDPREPFGAVDRDNREQERARMRVDQALRHFGVERQLESVGMEIEI